MPTTEWRLKAERDCQGGGPVQWIMFQVDGVDVDGDGDEGDDVDIYIMMQFCLFVTKNGRFLKRPVCLFVMFYPHFLKSRK